MMPWHCCCELCRRKILSPLQTDVSCTPRVTCAVREAGQGVVREEMAAVLDGSKISGRAASVGKVKVHAQ